MKYFLSLSLGSLLLGTTLFTSASLAQAPLREPAAKTQNHQEIDPKILLKAKDAFELLAKKEAVFIDVRSRTEFNAEHIEGAISFPYTVIRMTDNYPFKKDQKLVLYCGCPHHLSGLSAEELKKKGYPDVSVIDEGYFGWKALKYPIFLNPNAPERMSMSIEGTLSRDSEKQAFEDVFLLHPETGQLEATRTDAQGRFSMTLHFRGLSDADKVLLQWAGQNLIEISLAELTKKTLLELEIPKE